MRKIFFVSIILNFIIFSFLVDARGEYFDIKYKYKKGERLIYKGTITIVDMGGIPTEGEFFGDKSKALTSLKFSVPFVKEWKVLDVLSNGVAKINIKNTIYAEKFKSLGRDALKLEDVKKILKRLYFISCEGEAFIDEKGRIVSGVSMGEDFSQVPTSLPEEKVKVGSLWVYSKKSEGKCSCSICSLERVGEKDGETICFIKIKGFMKQFIPYNEISLIKRDIDASGKLIFNVDKGTCLFSKSTVDLLTTMVSDKGMTFGGRAQSFLSIAIEEELERLEN